MWLNEFKSGDIVVDNFGNKLEIKQIFKTCNVKIKVIQLRSFGLEDIIGNELNVGKIYIIEPRTYGEYGNNWNIVEKEVIQISTPIETLTVEQIDSQISELQKKKSEIVQNQLKNLVKGKFYQIISFRDHIWNCAVTDLNDDLIFINTFDNIGIKSSHIFRSIIKSIKPLPELDDAHSKFLTVLTKFS